MALQNREQHSAATLHNIQKVEVPDLANAADCSTLPVITNAEVGDTRLELVTPSLSSHPWALAISS